jgi:hypothetical protein
MRGDSSGSSEGESLLIVKIFNSFIIIWFFFYMFIIVSFAFNTNETVKSVIIV